MRFLIPLFLAGVAAAQPAGIDDLQRGFERPPDDCRIMMRWWWFGPAVTRPEIERELRVMKEAGIGGVEVQPVYPVALDDPSVGLRNLPFLSDEFIEALRFAQTRARELGLRVDLTLGSGWPYGGPQVSAARAAARLRIERVPVPPGARRVAVPDIGNGEKLIAAFLDGTREIADVSSGMLRLPSSPDGAHEIQFFIQSRTGQMVKRAAVGADGFVLDHYDRVALDQHLRGTGERLMQAFGPTPPRAIFCDSLEVYGGDWTPDFLEQFEKRRGYDLKPLLPLLAGNAPRTPALRNDWGRTLSELAEERFIAPLHTWVRGKGSSLRMQSYGMPPARLSSYEHVDMPEGEGANWKILTATRWASSASHLFGRPVTSSETWTWLHSPSFRATPLDVKAEADVHFLQGVNQLVGHGWPYTAEGVAYPGWRFYAAMVFDEKNPWWLVMPDVSLYLQRLSFLMRQGRPVNDVAVYLPSDDAWAQMAPGRVDLYQGLRARLGTELLARILEAGYGLDVVDDAALAKDEKPPYRALVVPAVERIPVEMLQRMEAFARSGGALLATRRLPSLAPGFRAGEAEHREVADRSKKLFEGRLVADESGLAAALRQVVPPDLTLSPEAPEIGFVHRSTESVEIYFLANTGNEPRSLKARFRVKGMQPEVWDPMTGRVVAAETADGAVSLDLEPYGSRVVVFSGRALPKAVPRRAAGPSLDLGGPWRVVFGDGSMQATMDPLRSWTDDPETRYFSGVATYEKSFTVPAGLLKPGAEVRIDFGESRPLKQTQRRNGMQAWLEPPVREAAVVWVNGERAGSLWCPPYSLDVTKLIRAGGNGLRIQVGNLAINYMAGRRLPDYRLLNSRYGTRFEPQDMEDLQPIPSGLLGPVKLVAR